MVNSNQLQDWLTWLETLHPKNIELGLDRVKKVADKVQLFQRLTDSQTKIITIAGTNGKGTCVATMQSLLLASEQSVGAFTSPHLLRFNERIAINGVFTNDADIVKAFQKIESARGDISLTYFEFGTLAAFELFLDAGVDFWLLEVGLGGRLDATNVLDADIAIVTSIDLDHQDWLGDDREKIAYQKAGIFRPHRFAICVDSNPPQSLVKHAAQIDSIFLNWEQDIHWQVEKHDWRWRGVDQDRQIIKIEHLPLSHLPTPSISAAIQAMFCLGFRLNQPTLCSVIDKLRIPGRCQQVDIQGRTLILDVAHNPAAARYLANRLLQHSSPPGRQPTTFAIFAAMADKDLAAMVEALAPLINTWYFAGLVTNVRAAPLDTIATILDAQGLPGLPFASVAEGIDAAIDNSRVGDRIVIFGSFYTVAEALQWLDAIYHRSKI